MSPSTDTADALFWKAYGSAIMKAVGDVTVNDKTSFYLSTKSQRGPPGGNGIAESFTNEGLFNIGNNLLPPDQLFYSPSTENSYIRQLQTYLAWVDVGGTPSSANIQAVTDTLTSMRAADIGATKALTEALASYKAQKDAGIVGSQDFASWFPANAPAYVVSVQNYQSKAAAYQKATKIAYGALADQKLADEAKLATAMSTLKNEAGFNMACGIGSPPSAKEINDATSARDTLKDPNTVWRPMYESQSYISVIKDAQSLVGSDKSTKNSFTLQSNEGSSVSESKFNKTTGSGGIGFSYAPWISFSANASHSDEQSSLKTSEFDSHIKITVNYDDISLVPINPSASWDLGDVRTKYQKVLQGAPESVKTLVKPTMMVLATRLGYTVDVGAAGKDAFDSMSKSVTSGGGSVSIFGIPCSFSAQASVEDDKTTHMATWNSADNTFTVVPTDNCGFATIVGLVGEKIVTM